MSQVYPRVLKSNRGNYDGYAAQFDTAGGGATFGSGIISAAPGYNLFLAK